MQTKRIKQYDKYLRVKRNLDGSIRIYRQSPYNTMFQYDVLTLKNQYFGSGEWVLRQIILMDTQRYDLVGRVIQNNLKKIEEDKDDRMTRDIVDTLFETGGEHIII